jgi:hypothetical protein
MKEFVWINRFFSKFGFQARSLLLVTSKTKSLLLVSGHLQDRHYEDIKDISLSLLLVSGHLQDPHYEDIKDIPWPLTIDPA